MGRSWAGEDRINEGGYYLCESCREEHRFASYTGGGDV